MVKSIEEKKHEFTIFLLNKKYKKISDIAAIVPVGSVDDYINEDQKAKAYIYKSSGNVPGWISSFKSIFNFNEKFSNLLYALISFIEVDNRVFVFTSSFGHSKISKKYVVNDFGLKVVLNEIDKDSLRSIDTRNLTLASHQKREVSSSNSSLNEFDFDDDEDFLKSISGKLKNTKYAAKISGSDSLKMVKRFDITNIKELCSELLESYNKSYYIDNGFGFIDHFKKVYDEEIKQDFNNKLLNAINSRQKKLVLAYPEIEEYSFSNYRISFGKFEKFCDDIDATILFRFLDKNKLEKLEIDDLNKINIELLDEDGKIFYKKGNNNKKYSLLNYVVFDFKYKSKKYIYLNNQIYEIEDNYYKKLIKDLEDAEESISYELPPIKHCRKEGEKGFSLIVENEGLYNKRAESENIKCLDKNFFKEKYTGKGGKIEIADLVTDKNEFVAVKTYKGSSTSISHLCMQLNASAELWAKNEDAYSKAIYEVVGGDMNLDIENRSKVNLVFAIAHKKKGKLCDLLPILSKISLRRSIKNIKKLGFNNVFIVKIDFEDSETKNIE